MKKILTILMVILLFANFVSSFEYPVIHEVTPCNDGDRQCQYNPVMKEPYVCICEEDSPGEYKYDCQAVSCDSGKYCVEEIQRCRSLDQNPPCHDGDPPVCYNGEKCVCNSGTLQCSSCSPGTCYTGESDCCRVVGSAINTGQDTTTGICTMESTCKGCSESHCWIEIVSKYSYNYLTDFSLSGTQATYKIEAGQTSCDPIEECQFSSCDTPTFDDNNPTKCSIGCYYVGDCTSPSDNNVFTTYLSSNTDFDATGASIDFDFMGGSMALATKPVDAETCADYGGPAADEEDACKDYNPREGGPKPGDNTRCLFYISCPECNSATVCKDNYKVEHSEHKYERLAPTGEWEFSKTAPAEGCNQAQEFEIDINSITAPLVNKKLTVTVRLNKEAESTDQLFLLFTDSMDCTPQTFPVPHPIGNTYTKTWDNCILNPGEEYTVTALLQDANNDYDSIDKKYTGQLQLHNCIEISFDLGTSSNNMNAIKIDYYTIERGSQVIANRLTSSGVVGANGGFEAGETYTVYAYEHYVTPPPIVLKSEGTLVTANYPCDGSGNAKQITVTDGEWDQLNEEISDDRSTCRNSDHACHPSDAVADWPTDDLHQWEATDKPCFFPEEGTEANEGNEKCRGEAAKETCVCWKNTVRPICTEKNEVPVSASAEECAAIDCQAVQQSCQCAGKPVDQYGYCIDQIGMTYEPNPEGYRKCLSQKQEFCNADCYTDCGEGDGSKFDCKDANCYNSNLDKEGNCDVNRECIPSEPDPQECLDYDGVCKGVAEIVYDVNKFADSTNCFPYGGNQPGYHYVATGDEQDQLNIACESAVGAQDGLCCKLLGSSNDLPWHASVFGPPSREAMFLSDKLGFTEEWSNAISGLMDSSFWSEPLPGTTEWLMQEVCDATTQMDVEPDVTSYSSSQDLVNYSLYISGERSEILPDNTTLYQVGWMAQARSWPLKVSVYIIGVDNEDNIVYGYMTNDEGERLENYTIEEYSSQTGFTSFYYNRSLTFQEACINYIANYDKDDEDQYESDMRECNQNRDSCEETCRAFPERCKMAIKTFCFPMVQETYEQDALEAVYTAGATPLNPGGIEIDI